MVLVIVRHAESVENADKYRGFYRNRRPYGGEAAHRIAHDVVGLTPRGFRQALWLGEQLAKMAPQPHVYTSTYRRSIDTADVAFAQASTSRAEETPLLDEQHYGGATYMTKTELFATYPAGADDRRFRKHLWVPPGGESLADGVLERARAFIERVRADVDNGAGRHVVAMTHHTTILALRSLLENRQLTDIVAEARTAKTPNAGIYCYAHADTGFARTHHVAPPDL